MYVDQKNSITFFPRRQRVSTKTGKAPLIVRINIDGLKKDKVVKGVRINPDHWDEENKIVKADAPDAKTLNKKIAKELTELQRHFDLVQANQDIATPEKVFKAYSTPIKAEKIKAEKIANLALSQKLDTVIYDYIQFRRKHEKATEFQRVLPAEQAFLLDQEQKALLSRIEKVENESNKIFDDKSWEKTLILATDAHLATFLGMAKVDHRSYTTLEKMWGRKKRLLEYIKYRHHAIDLPLADLEYKFIEQLKTYCMVDCKMKENSVCKHTQSLKGIIDRAVSNRWMPANIFDRFASVYKQSFREWMKWEQMITFSEFNFSKQDYNEIRDQYVFEAFTGYGYAEIRSSRHDDQMEGIDGKLWIHKFRRKTGSDETLPFLPIPLKLIEKYKNHPVCLKRGTLFPVPTNEHYNRCLKKMAKEIGIEVLLSTHSARYFFANEVLYNNGVQLKTIAQAMGHESLKSAEIYIRFNRTAVSEAMQEVEDKLHNPDGSLKAALSRGKPPAKVFAMRAV
jgi:site-specific recombinase XerD